MKDFWQISTEACRNILNEFLDKWTIDAVRQMTLEQYVSVGDKDTFCQWLETRTRLLGSIKGVFSNKFGIYKRKDKSKKPKNLYNDDDYSWLKFYGNDRNKAFNRIKNEILQIIDCSQKGQFERIDDLHLPKFVKWKIAYLYSNERLIPIFKKDVLVTIATHFGLAANHHTRNSAIQNVMIAHKPAHLSIYEYSEELYNRFGGDKQKKIETMGRARKTTRRATSEKNTTTQTRRGALSYIAVQKHNMLQEALKNKLIEKYGKANVFMEHDFVDIKVIQPDKVYFYEVKSSAYAGECVKEALGQILSYTHRDSDKRPKHLIVAGQYEPNADEAEYINYVKRNLNLIFDYEKIDFE
ncbi:MAG TPA: hypothetical protein VN784_01730 [Candidatus Limnocylindrales bacterium]|nr:hypothetical protein [Candidatus Limnocylindrales bacterium]